MLTSAVALVAVSTMSLAVGAGQGRPDFSGEWVLNLKRSTLHPDFVNLTEGSVRIVHRDPPFSFERTFVIAGLPRRLSYEITTDGAEQRTERSNAVTVSTMTWKANVLVLSKDQPAHGLKKGDLSTVVEVYTPDAVEVEFVTASGRTQALVTLPPSAVREVRDDDLVAVRPATSRDV
jgi:hypothetical protein